MLAGRRAWFERQLDLDPARLIFIDETGLSTKMARLRGRAPRGERCVAAVPHWALEDDHVHRRPQKRRARRALASGRCDGWRRLPNLCGERSGPRAVPGRCRDHGQLAGPQGDLPAHKVSGVRSAIEDVGAMLLSLPPYSPDFNPIEHAFAKLKALLRKAACRIIPVLWDEVADALHAFTPPECRNLFQSAGYDCE